MNITQEQHDQAKRELGFNLVNIGKAEKMPGCGGFTMVVFRKEDVPVGTEVYIKEETK